MIPKECLEMTVKEYRKWQKEQARQLAIGREEAEERRYDLARLAGVKDDHR